MTRKRVGEGLVEAFSSPCEACEGRGFIVHHHPVEASGADSSSKGAKSAKKSQKRAEPRRIEAGVEHERAKEALSAIAAASSRKDDDAPSEAPVPAAKGTAQAAAREVEDASSATGTEQASAPDQAESKASDASAQEATKRPRRRRRVAEATPVPDLPVHIDLPDPVETAEQAPAKNAVDIELPERQEKAPANRRRASRKAATAASGEPSSAPSPAASPAHPASQESAPRNDGGQAREAPASAQEGTQPRRSHRRRAAASSGVVEPEATPAVVVDLPARAEAGAAVQATRSTEDITLPEATDKPRTKRRRRAVSTGIVDAG